MVIKCKANGPPAAVWGGWEPGSRPGSPRDAAGGDAPSPAARTPHPGGAGPALAHSAHARRRQCEHTIIHYNSITVIKAGGMQRQEGVLPTKFTLRVISER